MFSLCVAAEALLQSTVLYHTILHYTTLYCTLLHYTFLCVTAEARTSRVRITGSREVMKAVSAMALITCTNIENILAASVRFLTYSEDLKSLIKIKIK